jgi:type III pantothenate kinase
VRSAPYPAPGHAVLVVDAGSTTTKVGLAEGPSLARLGAFPTGVPAAAGWQARFAAVIDDRAIHPSTVRTVAIASVVPVVVDQLRSWWARRTGTQDRVFAVDAAQAPVEIEHRPPSSLGADRIANALAAIDRYGTPVVVVDVGTAITCDLVCPGPRFAGGAIAPGPLTGYRGLIDRAPQLARAGGLALDGDVPEAAARSTDDAMRLGVLRGAAALIDSLVADHRRRFAACPVVVTGGLATTVTRLCTTATTIDPELTLRGIQLACTHAQER